MRIPEEALLCHLYPTVYSYAFSEFAPSKTIADFQVLIFESLCYFVNIADFQVLIFWKTRVFPKKLGLYPK